MKYLRFLQRTILAKQGHQVKLARLQQLLKRYHEGTATKAERYVVDQWYASLGTANGQVPGMEDDAKKAVLKSRLWAGVNRKKRRYGRYPRRWVFQAAAGIVLLLAVSAWLFTVRDRTGRSSGPAAASQARVVTTGVHQVKQIRLPDSTTVWLNANSLLEIPQDYGNKIRQVRLAGEAFFEVTPDPHLPFAVGTAAIGVEVLGTSFNIRSYESLPDIKVTVSTGTVRVSDTTAQQLSTLSADQELAYRKTDGTYRVTKVDAQTSPDWREGRIVLDHASFQELAQGFYNRYGVRLVTDDPAVLSFHYHLSLQTTMRQEEALELICTMVGKNYRKEENGQLTIY